MNQRSSIRKAQSKGKKLETKALEQQTRRMQQKLIELKKQMQVQRSQRDQKSQTGSRWKQSQTTAPLRGYATKIIEDQKNAFKKHGITPSMMATKRTTFNSVKDTKSQMKMTMDIITSPTQNEVIEQTPVFYDLASKFGKAKVTVQKVVVQDSVNKLLQSIGLLQYLDVFEKNHIYDIQLINKGVLEQMDIPPGHRIKILKKANQSKQQITDEKSNHNQIAYKKQVIKQQQVEVQSDEQQQQEQRQSQSSIFNGQYDEQKNAKQFEQAVLAFRNVHKQVQQIEIALQTQSPAQRIVPPVTKNKYACFSCYKSFISQEPYSINNRHFCTQKCLNKYKISIEDKCPKCQKIFNKLQGFPHNGIRYCRIQCSPEVKMMEQYFIKWKMEERQKQNQKKQQSN